MRDHSYWLWRSAPETRSRRRHGKALGSPAAAITLQVFSDYQCSHCKTLYEETLQPLIADYVSKGNVYLIHRDFPLPMHQHARGAAIYANASLRVNK